MSDKEPRRRKKRKDLQSLRKVHFSDDTRSEDQIFIPAKSESKDSDQEVEEEVVVPTYQPSIFAKFVFVLLFSGLVVSMSIIFISLQGTNKGEVDILDDHHSEEVEISHEDHDEAWSSSESSIEEDIGNLLPGIGSILSFNDEQIEEPQIPELEDHDDDIIDDSAYMQESSKLSDDSSSQDSDASPIPDSEVQHIEDIGNFVEDIVPEVRASEILHAFEEEKIESISDIQEPELVLQDEPKVETIPQTKEPEIVPEEEEEFAKIQQPEPASKVQPSKYIPNEDDLDSVPVSPSIDDYSDYTTYLPNIDETEYVSERYFTSEDTLSPEVVNDEEDLNKIEINDAVDDFTEMTSQSYVEEVLPIYEKADITNEADYEIRHQLDELDDVLEKSPDRALRKCEELLKLYKESPRLHHVKAQALDKLAETQRSNKQLEEAIASYQKVMSLKVVPEELYLLAGKRAADRMRFRGFMGKSVKLLSEMSEKFPRNVEVKNLLAVGYLMIGQNKQSKKVLYEVLKMSPDSGFAKVHLGFMLKTDDSNYPEAIKFLREGISSREPGVIDGRFFFQLGDALHRVGKQEEALGVYKEAVREGLFLSEYQRSLYNVNGLTGKPWWNPHSTLYAPYFKLLEKKWHLIRDEALSLTDERNSGFLPETEGLQEKGDWKQFELFARGQKIAKNCLKAPKTCDLVSQMPDAASCKRGQVKFSIMRPATHVWAHTGPTNCRLRSHLGLVIPEGASIRVANETRQWEEGKVLLFDDSFEHEVWHNGNASRLVLIVDFWHPELTAYQKKNLTPI